ncbi:MAG TPA: outer membrane beta-barrel protein, partial [Vicinamibacterales bacterium]|nr:outer membrane beta-barrel protein [Vicinamibacterales bacterium]
VSLAPATASADLRATAFAGATRINETNKGTLGAAVTFGGLLGIEFEAARIWLGSLENIDVVDVNANLTTLMGNLVLRLPTGPIQPYASGGVGLVRVTGNVDVPFLGNVVSASAQDVGYNIGAGVYLLPSPNVGFRADVRRFQTGAVSWKDITNLGDLPLPKFDFWRATAGITVKF